MRITRLRVEKRLGFVQAPLVESWLEASSVQGSRSSYAHVMSAKLWVLVRRIGCKKSGPEAIVCKK